MSIRREEIQRLKVGKYILIDGEPCVIKELVDSKGGKHGKKVYKATCIGMFDNLKRVEHYKRGKKVEIPEVLKGTAQINFIEEDSINIMDHETYQQFDIEWPYNDELKAKLKDLQSDSSRLVDSYIKYLNLAGRIKIEEISL